MKARKKPLTEIPVDSLGVDLAPKLKIKALNAPAKRQAGRKVASVDELVGGSAYRSEGYLTRDNGARRASISIKNIFDLRSPESDCERRTGARMRENRNG